MRGLIHLQSTELLDLVEWMRGHNRKPGPKITFTGFDMQVFEDPIEMVLKFLEQAESPDQDAVREAYVEVRKLGPQRVRFEDKAKPAALEAERVVRQAAAFRMEQNGYGYRDDMMARNAVWLARQAHPNEKIILWAHNGHIAMGGAFGERSMGQGLREAFGDDLYTVGFSFSQGSIQAVGIEGGMRATGIENHAVPAPPSGSGGSVLRSAGLPLFFLDFSGLPSAGALGRWLAQPRLFYETGANWNKDDPQANLVARALSKSFHGLVFVDTVNPTRSVNE